jgi:hypothetical protein
MFFQAAAWTNALVSHRRELTFAGHAQPQRWLARWSEPAQRTAATRRFIARMHWKQQAWALAMHV